LSVLLSVGLHGRLPLGLCSVFRIISDGPLGLQ
jgi:hypothetical protein